MLTPQPHRRLNPFLRPRACGPHPGRHVLIKEKEKGEKGKIHVAACNPRKAEPGTSSAGWETGPDRGAFRWRTALADTPFYEGHYALMRLSASAVSTIAISWQRLIESKCLSPETMSSAFAAMAAAIT